MSLEEVKDKIVAEAGDTQAYHNRYSKNSDHPGNKKYKKLPSKCAKCGSTKNLDIDHKDGNRKNNNRSNLRVLCRSCHRKMHDGGSHASIVSTACRIIEDPKSDASLAIAKSHKNSDLMYVEFILCHADKNGNQDEFTTADLKDSYDTAINKPINWAHTNRNIGVIFEAKYIGVNDISEADKKYYGEIDPIEKDFVVCQAAIWEYKNPTEAKIMRERQANGKLYFSMENKFGKAICSKCQQAFASAYDYCDHLLTRIQTKSVTRIFQDSNMVGAGVVQIPADEGAGTLALAELQEGKLFLSNLAYAKCFSDLDINNDVIPYLLWREGVKMRELDIPKDIVDGFGGDNTSFADDVNNVFPLDTEDNIVKTASYVLNNKLEFYTPEEKLYVVERLANAARELDINLTESINTPEGGIETMAIDRNAPEFKEELAKALNEELSKIEAKSSTKVIETELAEAKKLVEKLTSDLETATKATEKATAEYNTYKNEIESAKLAETRFTQLSEAGLVVEEAIEEYKKGLSKMDEVSFATLLKSVSNSVTAAKAAMTAEEKKKMEEKMAAEKAKKGEKPAKASKETDPVIESNVALANKVEDGEPEKDIFDIVLAGCK